MLNQHSPLSLKVSQEQQHLFFLFLFFVLLALQRLESLAKKNPMCSGRETAKTLFIQWTCLPGSHHFLLVKV